MRAHRPALAKRRAELLLRSARQREQLGRSMRAVDARLRIADGRIAVARRTLTIPLVAGLVAATWLATRRHDVAGVLVRAALLLPAARRIGHAIASRPARPLGAGPGTVLPPYG